MSGQTATPKMTASKAHWTAITAAVTSALLAWSGATEFDPEGFAGDVSNALTLVAAILIQGAVAWLTTFYKRNRLK